LETDLPEFQGHFRGEILHLDIKHFVRNTLYTDKIILLQHSVRNVTFALDIGIINIPGAGNFHFRAGYQFVVYIHYPDDLV
jgi:hypothetical protein